MSEHDETPNVGTAESKPEPVLNKSSITAAVVVFGFVLGAIWVGEPDVPRATVVFVAVMTAAGFFCLDRAATLTRAILMTKGRRS